MRPGGRVKAGQSLTSGVSVVSYCLSGSSQHVLLTLALKGDSGGAINSASWLLLKRINNVNFNTASW